MVVLKTLKDWNEKLVCTDKVKEWEKSVLKINDKLNALTEFKPSQLFVKHKEKNLKDSTLKGIPFAVKDNIAVEGFKLSCGSNLLKGLDSPYTATAVSKLQSAGACVVAKTNLDEFGMGSTSGNSCFGAVKNPWNVSTVPGGSSGGSAVAVASGMVPFSLGSDTGGSVRQPASFCGVYGLKPTYGAISRFGLVAYASSLDVIGIIASKAVTIKEVYRIMSGRDSYDQTSVDVPVVSHKKKLKDLVVGLPVNLISQIDPKVLESLMKTKHRLESIGVKCVDIHIGNLEYVVPAYYVIATAEASTNLARFDGIRYGNRAKRFTKDAEELIYEARTEGFGQEVKLRILLGTYVLRSGFQEKYYQQAQKIRRQLKVEFAQYLDKVDALLLPTYPVPPFPVVTGQLPIVQPGIGTVPTRTIPAPPAPPPTPAPDPPPAPIIIYSRLSPGPPI